MTWKQLVYQVEIALHANGIDPDRQPIHIAEADLWLEDHAHRTKISVNVSKMPKSVSIRINGNSLEKIPPSTPKQPKGPQLVKRKPDVSDATVPPDKTDAL